MKKLLLAVAAAAMIAIPPAQATTFLRPTFIYVASGVYDSGHGPGAGTATTVQCSDLSGNTARIAVHFYSSTTGYRGKGGGAGGATVSTHDVSYLDDDAVNTNVILQGFLVVESDESGVYCTAMVVDAAGPPSSGIPLHMVRFKSHPGTVE
jgi:hypothetical protein